MADRQMSEETTMSMRHRSTATRLAAMLAALAAAFAMLAIWSGQAQARRLQTVQN